MPQLYTSTIIGEPSSVIPAQDNWQVCEN